MKRYDAIAKRFKKRGGITGVEVGVWKGKNAANLLPLLPGLTLYMVDRWQAYSDEERERDTISEQARLKQAEFEAAEKSARKAVTPFGKRTVILKMSSAEASEQFDDGSIDFVFLDGDHSYEGLKQDIELWLPKVKPGGYLCGHDYTPEGKRPGITKAVHEAFGKVKRDADSTWFYRIPEQEEDLFLLFEHTESLRQEAGI